MEELNSIAIRELRNSVAAVVRRAGAGERLVVTVDGQPVAQLGPLLPTGEPTLDDLIAAGLILVPRMPHPSTPAAMSLGGRSERTMAELRGK